MELPPLEDERDESHERQLGLVDMGRIERGPESAPAVEPRDEAEVESEGVEPPADEEEG